MNRVLAKERGYYVAPTDMLKAILDKDIKELFTSDGEIVGVDEDFINRWKVVAKMEGKCGNKFGGLYYKRPSKEQLQKWDEIQNLTRRLKELKLTLKKTI